MREAGTLREDNETKHTQDLDAEGFFPKQMPKAESMAVFSFRNVNKLCYFKSLLDTDKTGFKYLSQATNLYPLSFGKRKVWIPDLQGAAHSRSLGTHDVSQGQVSIQQLQDCRVTH